MFGLGALFKAITRPIDARRQIAALDEAITVLERETNQSVLETLSGVERFECAVRLVDSTFLLHISEAGSRERRQHLIEKYLERLHHEYEEASMELVRQPATRAEVVALSLALKELALTLDDEVESARLRHEDLIRGLRERVNGIENTLVSAAAARTLTELEPLSRDLDALRAELVELRGSHHDSVTSLRKSLESAWMRTEKELAALGSVQLQDRRVTGERIDSIQHALQDQRSEAMQQLGALDLRLDQTAREHAETVATLRSERERDRATLSAGLETLRGQHAAHRTELLSEISGLRARHEELAAELAGTATRIRNWLLILGAGILIVATLAGAALQG